MTRLLVMLALMPTIARAQFANPPYDPCDIRSFNGDCTATTDVSGAGGALTVALADPTCAGTVKLPAGCGLLVGTPGEGDPSSSFVLASHTHLVFDPGAYVQPARRFCKLGHYIGAACTADAQCIGGGAGSCVYDGGLSSAYAPTSSKTYKLFTAAVGATDITIDNPTIKVGQMDPFFRCSGGTNDGAPCSHFCKVGTGIACDADTDCNAFDCGAGTCTGAGPTCVGGASAGQPCGCQQLADCKTAASPGACGGTTDAENTGARYEPGTPAGPGEIVPIDLSNATNSFVRNPIILDHKYGSDAIKVGNYSGVVRGDTTRWTTSYPAPGFAPAAWPIPAVVNGITVGGYSVIEGSGSFGTTAALVLSGEHSFVHHAILLQKHGYDVFGYGINITGGGSTADHNAITLTPKLGIFPKAAISISGNKSAALGNTIYGTTALCPNASTTTCMTGVELGNVTNLQARVEDNHFDTLLHGIESVGTNPYNYTLANNRMTNVYGWNIAVGGAGPDLLGNYFNPGSRSALSCGSLCANAGATCASDADCTSCTVNSPKCTPEPLIVLGNPKYPGGAAHATITGGKIAVGRTIKQCTAVANGGALGQACTVSACASGACNAVSGLGVCARGGAACCSSSRGSGACTTIPDVGVKYTDYGTGAAPQYSDNTVGPVEFLGGGSVGVDLSFAGPYSGNVPSGNTTLTRMRIGDAHFAGLDTGVKLPASTRPLLIDNLSIVDNSFPNTTTPIENWSWLEGNMFGNYPMLATDDQVTVTFLKRESGDTAGPGDFVEISTRADNSFKKATVFSRKVVGVLLDDPAGTNVGKIAIGGLTSCNAEPGVARGDVVSASGATAGRATSDAATSGNPVAIALTATASNSIRCELWPQPASPRLTMLSSILSASTSVASFVSPNAQSECSTESSCYVPAMASHFYKLICAVSIAPGAAKSRTCDFRTCTAGASPSCSTSSLTCTISGASSTTCSVTAASGVAVTDAQRIDFQTVPSGTPAAADISFAVTYSVDALQ